MDKKMLKNHMANLEQKNLNHHVVRYENYLAAQDIDEDAIKNIDDLSHREASGEVSDGIDQQIHGSKADLVDIKEIDFSPKQKVEPGAVLSLGGKNLVIAVATEPFDFEGKEYLGISVHAPIYTKLENKTIGDTIDLQNTTYTIESIV